MTIGNAGDELSKKYEPAKTEQKWYDIWEKKEYFKADNNSDKPYYSITIPPPNVTGVLHIGHALNQTLQDILIRFKRMSGFNTLWLPGMDHAGIATQNVVDRNLREQEISREELGREKFIEKVWEWKAESGGTILKQMRNLGSSVDWSRERFTMDEGLSKAVREVFVSLYKEDLIYQGNYMVNWCPRCLTALSDLEVEHEDVNGKLYYVNYKVKGSDETIMIATTRPETILGDTAIAVHPDDERFKDLIGKTVFVPLIDNEIPVIADSYVDPEFGTGALKITPAHDINDFEVGTRHNLETISVMDEKGFMNTHAGPYDTMDRFECRKLIVKDLEEKGYLEKVDDYANAVGGCYRCKTVIEPRISKQWFVKTKPLAAPAIEMAKSGELKFHPKSWENTYYSWMENIKDWCISRQIWWGHQIPAWHCIDCAHITVTTVTPKKCEKCESVHIRQETDVLDTWFSSALWPFSTMGWPDKTKDLEKFYPTSTLISGFDILFFWIARMVMMGIKFTGKLPFENVYIHALVRDANGQKMSKSKGNVVDPLLLIEEFGTDAMRFTFAAMASPGRDIKLSNERLSGYRNFMNKIWNSARFIQMNISETQKESLAGVTIENIDSYSLHDRWILSTLQLHIEETIKQLDLFRFDEAANGMYGFLWHKFCDWYLELGKPDFTSKEANIEHEKSMQVLIYTFETLLRLIHPVIPFITEEVWQSIPHKGDSIVIAPYPQADQSLVSKESIDEMELIIDIISGIRGLRSELNLPMSKKIDILISGSSASCETINKNKNYIQNLAKLDSIGSTLRPLEGCATSVVRDVTIYLQLKDLVNIDEERAKIKKEIKALEIKAQRDSNKLLNEDFLAKAPDIVIEKTKNSELELLDKIKKLTDNLEKLG